jgi:hypothetical protein
MASINALPEELQLSIISFLESPSPSSRKLRLEPSLSLTDSPDCTLKHISLVSRRWRRLVLPTLFVYTRLRLDAPPDFGCNACRVCDEAVISTSATRTPHQLGGNVPPTDEYHAEMITAALTQCDESLRGGRSDDEAQQMGEIAFATKERLLPSTALTWIPRYYHACMDVIRFLQNHDLTKVVDSFVLYTDQMLGEKLHRFPHEVANKDWRFPASAAFWAHLLAVIDPTTVTILAPPIDLACLTNCAIDTFGDWAFSEMDFHILSLRQSSSRSPKSTSCIPTYASLQPIPATYPAIAPSSVLTLRPWTHLSLNEGPFLKAYGTYEFFERGPPSLVYSIKDSIIRNRPQPEATWTASKPPTSRRPLSSLTSLDYTAVFPFANHADFSPILHQITHLSLQLAPDAQSNILNDRARLGKADLADCWTELLTTYSEVVTPLASVRRPNVTAGGGQNSFTGDFTWDTSRHGVAVRRLEALDFRIKAMQEEFDELFVPLCLPVWVEAEPGVFSRPQDWEGR